jgi:hypothetical protein
MELRLIVFSPFRFQNGACYSSSSGGVNIAQLFYALFLHQATSLLLCLNRHIQQIPRSGHFQRHADFSAM